MRPEEALLGAAAEAPGPCRLGADLSWDHGESVVREIVAADGTIQIGKAHRRAMKFAAELHAYRSWVSVLESARLASGEHPTSLSATASGRGYWVFTDRGRVVPFGDAQSFGDMTGTKLNGPVLDSVATPTGKGYYMVASDGGVFAFDAPFRGSMGDKKLNKPVVGMVRYGDGYRWSEQTVASSTFPPCPSAGRWATSPPRRRPLQWPPSPN